MKNGIRNPRFTGQPVLKISGYELLLSGLSDIKALSIKKIPVRCRRIDKS
jgi:hypothetical protein